MTRCGWFMLAMHALGLLVGGYVAGTIWYWRGRKDGYDRGVLDGMEDPEAARSVFAPPRSP